MKLSSIATHPLCVLSAFSWFVFAVTVVDAEGEGECTHGKLYIVDDATSDVHVVDVSSGNLQNLTVETTVTLPSEGAGMLAFYGAPAPNPLIVQYRGKEETFFLDSYVSVINTGFTVDDHGDHIHVEYEAPTIVEGLDFTGCVRPIHQVRHDNKIAIHCDGSFDATPQANTTIFIVNEATMTIVHSMELEGTHHGVAIPVDDGHILHSIPTQNRTDRVVNASSLPDTFQVVDYEGNILHELTDETDPNKHCRGFHGSASVQNTFALGCDASHGGILIVDYIPDVGYESRAVTYPEGTEFDELRIGSFAYHYNADHMIGRYSTAAGGFFLAAITGDSTALETRNLLPFDSAAACGFMFEVGQGEHLLVLTPDGTLHAFALENGEFQPVTSKQVVPDMESCDEAAFVAGIQQAFIATPANQKLYAVDLAHIEEDGGEMEVYESTLPFTPTAMTVSGFTLKAACTGEHHDHDHGGDGEGTQAPGSGSSNVYMVSGLSTLVMAAFVLGVAF